MDSSDRNKLTVAGFRVMRASKLNKTITEHTGTGAWKLIERFDTITALNAGVKQLRIDDKIIFEMSE